MRSVIQSDRGETVADYVIRVKKTTSGEKGSPGWAVAPASICVAGVQRGLSAPFRVKAPVGFATTPEDI
ncbi:hypothetical protein NBRC116586_30730 [Pseudooceanicola nitratireducens]